MGGWRLGRGANREGREREELEERESEAERMRAVSGETKQK